jgi:Tol biopolymer transport system component
MTLGRLDRIAIATAGLLLALLAVVVLRGDRVGVPILQTSPLDSAGAGAAINIEFGQRMNAGSVQAHFSITPVVQGKFFWNENSVNFLPDVPLQEGQHYLVHLAKGAQGQLGHDLLADINWSFEVRTAGIVFLRLGDSGYELWALPDLEGKAIKLSPSDGVFDYTVSPDGEAVIFSVVNEQSGIDLWTVNRDGEGARILLPCGADRCFAPSVSRVRQISYSRATAPLAPGETYSAPRIWLLDSASGETVRLHLDTQKIGYGSSWSPDAQHLAYYSGVASQIVVVDMRNGNEIYLPTRAGVTGSWSADSQQMVYFDVIQSDESVVNQLYRANFATQDVLPFFDPQPANVDYSDPVVSPDGQWVAVTMRAPGPDFNEQLWVMPIDGSYATVAVDEPGYLYSSYSWSSDSQRVLYYRLKLGTADRQAQVWLWDREIGASQLLVEPASAPVWLP